MELMRRYKQTDLGLIPDDWEIRDLGSLVTYTNGKAHEKNITDSGRFVVVNSKFISSEGITRKYSDSCFCPTSKGDVLMVMSDVPNGRAIAKCFRVESDDTYTVNQRICVLSPMSIDGKLLFYLLDRNPFYLAFDDGAKQTNLRKDEVLSCPLRIPTSADEQRAIAGALSDVDALIVSLDQLIAKKRDLKQAAAQQLLTGKKRLPRFSEEWKVKRLGDVFSISAGKSKSAYVKNGARYWVVDMGSVSRDGRLIVSKGTNYQGDFLKIGDLVMPKDDIGGGNIIGKVGYIDADETYVLGDHVYCLRANVGDPLFLSYVINGHQINNALRKKVIGSAQLGLGRKSVEEQEIPFPPPSEQTAVAEVLSDMDAEITALEQRRNKTLHLKQGMMQELLTGKTRLN